MTEKRCKYNGRGPGIGVNAPSPLILFLHVSDVPNVEQKRVDGAVAMEAEAREREGLAMGRVRKVMEV